MNATIIIITAAVQMEANIAAKQYFDPAGGELTFTNPVGTLPNPQATTHYWCADRMLPANRALLDIMVAQPPFAGNVQVFDYNADNDPGFPHAKLGELGLAVYAPPLN